MQLVEQHVIDRHDPRYGVIDAAAFKSKNLYNAALYEIRQSFIHEGVYLPYEEMDRRMQSHEAYRALPTKVSQQVLLLLHKNWLSFFEALAAYQQDPSRFTGRPRLPKYKHKTEGRNILIYTLQALQGGQSKQGIQGIIKPSGLALTIKTQQHDIFLKAVLLDASGKTIATSAAVNVDNVAGGATVAFSIQGTTPQPTWARVQVTVVNVTENVNGAGPD